jgi:enoyl reductase-like protein
LVFDNRFSGKVAVDTMFCILIQGADWINLCILTPIASICSAAAGAGFHHERNPGGNLVLIFEMIYKKKTGIKRISLGKSTFRIMY